MNIIETFVAWLISQGYGTALGTDIFIGGAPLEASNCYWVLSGGGSNIRKNTTGEKQKNYVISIFYRNTDGQDVYNKLQDIEELLNQKGCVDLSGYTILEVEATQFPTDQDLDANDRTVGLVQATITAYQNI